MPGGGSGFLPMAFRPGNSSLTGGNNETVAHDYFRQAGWSEAQTDGLLANLKAESGFNPQAFNGAGGGEGAQGIAQWRGDRVRMFHAMFGHDPKDGTFTEQLMFVQWELTHSEKAAGDALRAVGDARRAGYTVNRSYERSGTDGSARGNAAVQYGSQFRDRSVQVRVDNNTGGNSNVVVNTMATSI
jgi:hypothetical protein